jgi:ABC-2 type transport system permease protein
VGGYGELFRAGFARQATYRAALVIGVAANLFFGVFRTAIFLALYRQRGEAGGLELADALTYVWVVQTLFGVVFAPWMWEFAQRIRSGDVVVDLLRPGDPLLRELTVDVGRSTFTLLTRGVPQLVLAGVLLDLRLPNTPVGLLALSVALMLSLAAAAELRFLFCSLAFWTPDYRGWWTLLFGTLWFGGGFLVPVEFLPGVLRSVAEHGPLAALLVMPVRVATGRGIGAALGLQLAWVLVGVLACRALMGVAERRLVVHGG